MNEEETLKEIKAYTKRECGKCSMCCRLLDVPEINKPVHGWCQHAHPGKGCAIYADRPTACKGYVCCWLMTKSMPDYWHPLKAKMIMDFAESPHAEIPEPDMRVHVHPDYPNRWKEDPYYTDLLMLARAGLDGYGGPWPGMYYKISIMQESEHKFIILPNKVIPWSAGVTVRLPNNDWDFISTKTQEDAIALNNKLAALSGSLDQRIKQTMEIVASLGSAP